MSLDTVLKNKGLTVKKAAAQAGIEPSHLSAYKTGQRTMGKAAAKRLADVFGESPEELILSNRAAMLDRAIKRQDRHGILNACKGLLFVAEDAGADGETLDQIVEIGTRFAAATKSAALDFYDSEEHVSGDGRRADGTRVIPLEDLE